MTTSIDDFPCALWQEKRPRSPSSRAKSCSLSTWRQSAGSPRNMKDWRSSTSNIATRVRDRRLPRQQLQESGTGHQRGYPNFCTTNFGVKFPMFRRLLSSAQTSIRSMRTDRSAAQSDQTGETPFADKLASTASSLTPSPSSVELREISCQPQGRRREALLARYRSVATRSWLRPSNRNSPPLDGASASQA